MNPNRPHSDIMTVALRLLPVAVVAMVCQLVITSCARMGSPDGGWYDERPPYVVGAYPVDRDTNVTSNKIRIDFNEFIKVDNITEKVVFSPPQMEQPDVKAHGRHIYITLNDTLLQDFSRHRMRIKDTDKGRELLAQIADLEQLLAAYRSGQMREH